MSDLFRKTSLEKLSSPEQLDRAIVITPPSFWIALTGGFIIVLGALLWAVFGRIPISVESQGIYLNGEGIRSVYGEVDGIITDIRVKEGDQVKEGDVVAVVGGGEITSQIEKLSERIENVQKVTLESTSDVATADNKSLLELKDERIGLLDAYTQANEELSKKRAELLSEQKKESEIKAQLESSKSNYYQTINDTGDSSTELTYSHRQNDLSNYQSEYSMAKQTAQQAADEESQIKAQYDAQKKLVETLEQEVQTISAKEEELALAIQEMESLRQQLENQATDAENQIKAQYDEQKEMVDALAEEVLEDPEKEEALSEASQELDELQQQLENQTAVEDNQLKTQYETQKELVETLEKEIQDLSSKKEELSTATQEMETLQQQLNNITEEKERSQKELSKAKDKLEDAEDAFEDAKDDYSKELSRQSENSAKQEIAGNEYTQLSSDYAEQKSKVEALKQSIDSLEQEATSAETSMNTQTEKIQSSFDATKASLIDELNRELEQQIENLEKYEIVSTQEGTVQEVVTAMGSMATVGSEIIKVQKGNGDQKEALCYMALGNGKKVVPGMKVMIYPTTVNKQEYGHMTGTVESVAGYVTSQEEMKKKLGDDTLVQSFLANGPVVEVVCSIEEDPNTVSGYAWSSKKGRDIYLADGTMLETSIIVEKKAPITMVIPLLKSLFTESVSSAEEEAQ